jgi:FAD:protein FMN transferase
MKNLYHPITLFFLLLLTACSKNSSLEKISGFAQGTSYNITFEKPAAVDLAAVTNDINKELEKIDAIFSNYRSDSVIEKFNAQTMTTPVNVDAELVALIEVARSVHRASHGCYDLSIKPLFDLWGFKKDEFSPPTDDQLALTLSNVGFDNLETLQRTTLRKQLPNLEIDMSSIGQGYTVGKIASLLQAAGVNNYLVEIGGELSVKGKKTNGANSNGEPWRIAVEKPLPNQRKLHKIVSFDSGKNLSLMTSGTYRHYFDEDGKRYSHIIDARTGKPVEHSTVAVTVLHPDPSLADAWSTALLCLGVEEGLKVADENQIAALFINQDNDQLIEQESEAMANNKDVKFSSP